MQGAISGVIFGLADVTAQSSSRGLGSLDWARTVRSVVIGAFAQGPISHWAYSSDGSFIDGLVDQMQVRMFAYCLASPRFVVTHLRSLRGVGGLPQVCIWPV